MILHIVTSMVQWVEDPDVSFSAASKSRHDPAED